MRTRDEADRLLDHVLETGEPLEIKRNGQILRLVPERGDSWLDRLRPIPGLHVVDSDTIHQAVTWEWDPDRAINPS